VPALLIGRAGAADRTLAFQPESFMRFVLTVQTPSDWRWSHEAILHVF